MSILTDWLPTELEICGKHYPINTDFRTWIKFEQLFRAENITADICFNAISLCFRRTDGELLNLPPTLTDTLNALLWFYTKGHSTQNAPQSKSESAQPAMRVYCFEQDADCIYAAFLQQYGIDLAKTNMHWWTFKACLDNLCDDTRFVQTVKYRSMDLSKIKDNDQRRFYAHMKQLVALPDNRTAEQKEDAFTASFAGLF